MQERYPNIQFSQFMGAEMMAKKYGLTKDQLDEFGFKSHQKAIAATQGGRFKDEIVAGRDHRRPRRKTELHTVDEGIRFDVSLDGIKGVKLLHEGGAITAATSSQICDGASGVMVVSEAGLKALGVEPLARIHHMTVIGGDPVIMLEAPMPAHQARAEEGRHEHRRHRPVRGQRGLRLGAGRLAARTPAPIPTRLNVNGGAIALGHPLGASGTKLMTTLLYALKDRGKRYGLQTMCEGGGLANVTIVERL